MGLREVTFKVFRFDSKKDILPCYKTYVLKPTPKETMFDILNSILKLDDTLSFEQDVIIKANGLLGFAKDIKVSKFVKSDEIVLEPVDSKYVLKDFIVNYSNLIARYNSIKPLQDVQNISEIAEFNSLAVAHFNCPIVAVSDDFAGPLALSKAYKLYQNTSNPKEQSMRLEALEDAGLWDCIKCGKCDGGLVAQKVSELRAKAILFGSSQAGAKEAKSIKKQIVKSGYTNSFCTILNTKCFRIVENALEFSLLAKNSRLKIGSTAQSKNLDEIQMLANTL